jgi:hypothetical protein
MGLDPEGLGPRGQAAGGDLGGLGVFGIAVVLAGIDHRQLPERGHVHDLVPEPLRGGAVAEEADRDLVGAPQLGDSAAPVAMPMEPPTMALAPRLPWLWSAMCIDPPLPRQ